MSVRMSQEWIDYFFDIAYAVSRKSKDPRTKIGAVIVGQDKQILATGFNGFSRGDADLSEDYASDVKYDKMIHAEANAITQCARHGIKVDGSSIFISGLMCCSECAKLISQSGIKEVYAVIYNKESYQRWEESFQKSMETLFDNDVRVFITKSWELSKSQGEWQ